MKQSGDAGLMMKMPHYCWVAVVIVLLCLKGCSSTGTTEDPIAASTPAEKAIQLRERLLVLQAKLNEQKAALKKVVNNEADLELLLRLMSVKQRDLIAASGETVSTDSSDIPSEGSSEGAAVQQLNIDYLQTMASNQAALRSDLAKLIHDLTALSVSSQ